MGNELCCSRQQEMFSDIKFKNPEQNILSENPNTKNNQSFDDKDELNIIEHIKTNKTKNNIDQSNTKSIIIQNDEFMYERFDSKINSNNKNDNIKIIEDKNLSQDKMKITDIENNKFESNEKNDLDVPEDTNEINKVYDNNLKDNKIDMKNSLINKKFSNVVIDEKKIIISYLSKEPIKINLEENYFKNSDIIKENGINIQNNNKSIENSLNNTKNKLESTIYDSNYNNIIIKDNNSNLNNRIEINTDKTTQNGSLFENINYTLDNNIKTSNIFQQNEISNTIQYNESEIIKNNNINSSPEININQTFFPKATDNNSNYIITSDPNINNLYLTSKKY